MRTTDIIFSLICGRVIALIVSDVLRELGFPITTLEQLVIWVGFPFFALFCLWVASIIGRKVLFIFQIAKHVLVGAFATIVDLKIFELMLWLILPYMATAVAFLKGISFIVSTILKYWGNKYWVFRKHEKTHLKKEMIQFFSITVVGLFIDVAFFYYCSKVIGPQFNLSLVLWTKISVIAAALAAAIWNFIGYKFFVFKK